ncbi:Rieske (2Fe-2S) protein [Terricaulis sp.]|uniref:Rieske (2Fe-2S) protein n=1 Tax=Terricaulis sp. TaxID=2768686 RepID=UPI003783F55C
MSLASGTKLARVDEIPEAGGKIVDVGGVSLLLTRSGDAVHAFINRCTHAEYRLERADGRLLTQEGRFVVCHAHGASYALDSGACAGGPCTKNLTRVAVEVRSGEIFAA